MIKLNAQLRILRELRNLTQTELAELAIIGKRTLHKAESGEPSSMETALSIAGALGVHPEEILDETCVDALTKGPFEFHRYVESLARPQQNAYCRNAADAESAVVKMRESWVTH
ncbi:MAG: helix-turn-helix transcriptional regulator, partial [Planctomycetota bacterium]